MALERVLVDGYSLLHHWTTLAPGKLRHPAAAQEALIAALPQYPDTGGATLSIRNDYQPRRAKYRSNQS